jgi:pyridoxine/pyridoxamine 5'-phosphate oxidase
VSLERIEFWQGEKYRLHDRMVYMRTTGGGYRVERLCP